jgi:FolB domain-containing protein
MDKIIIKCLKVKCIIGTLFEERTKKQEIEFNIELNSDLSAAGASDDLNDTVNYQAVEEEVYAMAENSSFLLLERLAEEAAKVCLKYDPVRGVRITLDKPGALKHSRSVAVCIERNKQKP